MQRDICELVKDAINATSLGWLDRVCGMVETIQEKVVTANGTVVKQYPAYRNPRQRGCDAGNSYQRCTPDTKLRSLVYLEAEEPNSEALTANYTEYAMRVNVVVWCNLKQINPVYYDASDIADELMGTLPDRLTASGAYHTIRLDVNGCSRDVGIINKYSYDEAESQYLIYPFDFTIISMMVRFRRTNNCHGSTVLNPSSCKNYT